MYEPVNVTLLRDDWLRVASAISNVYLQNVIRETCGPVLLGNCLTLTLSSIHANIVLVAAEVLDIEGVGSDLGYSTEEDE